MNTKDFEEIKGKLFQLVETTDFADTEKKEVTDFLEHKEYGLALQTFVDIVIEEKKAISEQSVKILENLAKLMEIEEEINIRDLSLMIK